MNKQEQLLTILYDLSQIIGSEMQLQPLLRKLLQRLMYHTGYACGFVLSREPLTDGNKKQRLQIAIGDRQLQKYMGEYLDLSALSVPDSTQQEAVIDLTMLPVRQNYYHALLNLTIPGYGVIMLLSVEEGDERLPFEQMFTPVLANLAKTIQLCQQSEAYTASLIADRDKVRRANKRFRQALDTCSDFIFLIDSKNSRIIDYNQSAVRALGYGSEEMLALRLENLLTENSSTLVCDLVHRLEANHQGEVSEFNFKCKNGRRFPVEIRFSLLPQENKAAMLIAVVSDIAKRKVAEIELFNARQLAETTLHSIGDAVITTDNAGLVTGMNPVAEQLTGWFLQEVKGHALKSIFPIIDASTREAIENPVEKVIATGETVYLSNHTTLIAKDGTEHQIADSAAPILNADKHILGMVLVFNDVTEQYKLRENAAESRRNLQAIMDNTLAVIYVKDIEGRFTFINRQFEQLFHIHRDDINGKTLHDIFPKDIADEMQRNDKTVLAAGCALESEEVMPQDDGFHSYVAIKFPLRDSNGNIYAVCGISTDISERKKQEKQLRRSQKMDALGKLTGGIAHDYNNMLGVVLGYADLLKGHLVEKPELLKYVDEIHRAGERGAKLTKKLLAFSRNKNTDAESLDINALLQEERHMLEKTLTARIDLVFNLDSNLWPVWLDSGELEDAIVNISINAMHAMKSGGRLVFRTRNEYMNMQDAQLLNLQAGEYILLSITDTGCGMDEATREKIFDPFFSTKGEQGTGLGLSQVYGFVERSNGGIKVYSELSRGTQLILYFPRYQTDKGENKRSMGSAAVSLGGNETILVVDDEPALLNLTCEILGQQGYKTLCAENAKQALQFFTHKSIDLLLSDVIMPEMDGYQLAAIVQKKYPEVKIQLASGFADDHYVDIVDDSLHQYLLHKPLNSQTLLRRIRELFDN